MSWGVVKLLMSANVLWKLRHHVVFEKRQTGFSVVFMGFCTIVRRMPHAKAWGTVLYGV